MSAKVSFRPPRGEGRSSAPFGRRSLGHPDLDRAFALVHRLHPIRRVVFGRGWTRVEFARPVPWPRFLRLEVSRPFWPAAAELSREVCARGVAALTLGDGALEASVLSSSSSTAVRGGPP